MIDVVGPVSHSSALLACYFLDGFCMMTMEIWTDLNEAAEICNKAAACFLACRCWCSCENDGDDDDYDDYDSRSSRPLNQSCLRALSDERQLERLT